MNPTPSSSDVPFADRVAAPSPVPTGVVVLPDVLQHQARLRPEACALRFEGQAMRYGQLAQRASQAAARLWHACGVRAGDRVAYLGFNHADQVTLLFALARIGAVLVPLNYRLAPAEWQALRDDCRPCCVLHDDPWAEAAQALAAPRGLGCDSLASLMGPWPKSSTAAAAVAYAEAPALARPDAPVLLVYTSGTTGAPKGALHTQANLVANMRAAQQVQALVPADRVVTVLPLFHVGGLCIQTLPALWAGAEVTVHARFDPAALLAGIAQDRPSLTLQVPATLRALVNHPDWPGTDLSCLRAVWAGSSTLPADLVAAVLARGVPLCNVYGATETGPVSIALPAARAFSHAGACGWPAPGVEVRLDPVAGNGASHEEAVGEICLRGPNVVARYWPDLPACDAAGWFHTGDLACVAADGSYRVVGRAKDMIISGGENIYPAEIENLLGAHAAVAECAVLGLPDPQWGEVVVAVVVLVPGHDPDDEELMACLDGHIARYKLPRQLLRWDALPKTALGKVQKPLLRQMLAPKAGTSRFFPARPRDAS